MNRPRDFWPDALERCAEYVAGFHPSPTLRQVHYFAVSRIDGYSNTDVDYKQLSSRTAQARRLGAFPDLSEEGRRVDRPYYEFGLGQALKRTLGTYRLDRTGGQPIQLWIVLEKRTLLAQVRSWTQVYGLPVVPLGGYGSQTICDRVHREIELDERPIEVLYVGDFDPTGMDIERDMLDRVGLAWSEVHRVAVRPEQIDEYNLPSNPGKRTDSRARAFIAEHGELVQVEVEAFDPDDLRDLIVGQVQELTDEQALEAVRDQEEADREELEAVVERWENS